MVVTGANGLLTSAVAARLASEGVPLVLHVHRDTSRIESTPRLAACPRVVADLARRDGREHVAVEASSRQPLGGLVLGASRFSKTPIEDLTGDTIREILTLELESHLELVSSLAGTLVDGARVVLFSDTAIAFGWPDYPVYLAAKGGLDAAVRSLALALGPRVVVLAVAPGSIEGTPPPPDGDPATTTALGRRGTRDEVAAAVVGLMGLPSSVVQGATVPVDGGRRLRQVGP